MSWNPPRRISPARRQLAQKNRRADDRCHCSFLMSSVHWLFLCSLHIRAAVCTGTCLPRKCQYHSEVGGASSMH
ncbi:hypothetical protein BC628DRAFT_1370779 [Trametes gibbosa]|nr:hypothetical protein BC628DRAFT_1370779 [Trametes gibbosa]